MEGRLTMVFEPRIDFHTVAQQEIDDICAAELRSPRKSVPHLVYSGRGYQGTVIMKECLDDIETTDSRSRFQVQSCAVVGEELRRFSAPVVQAPVDRAAPVRTVDDGPTFD